MEAEERPSKIRKTEGSAESSLHESEPSKDEVADESLPAGDVEARTRPSNSEASKQGSEITEPAAHSDTPTSGTLFKTPNPLSKNQQKKLRKRQAWEAKQPERKAKRKEQRKRKRERDKIQRAAGGGPTDAQRTTRKDGQILPVTVVFDCDYDSLMHEKEIISLGSQLTRCYSENRNAKFRARLAVSSFGGRLKERFDFVLTGAYKSWHGFTFSEDDFVTVAEQAGPEMASIKLGALSGAFKEYASSPDVDQASKVGDNLPAGEIVYLSSDSDVTLTELKPYSTYIIGGLVDRNRYKGKCYKAARDRNLLTAKLPIGDYLEMSSRHILTTNHVLEIMLKWLELRDWGEAFTEVIPKRKGGILKRERDNGEAGDEECVLEESDEGSIGHGAEEEEQEETDSDEGAQNGSIETQPITTLTASQNHDMNTAT